ncbi:MAG: DedA family protein [Propionibacteriaceae bacterium]|nr:DedA family protein [Propionibacteriaceae bacterium]
MTNERTETSPEETARDWWDDPAMPWRHKPSRSDVACMTWFGVIGVVSLILLPMRAWLIGDHPHILAMLTSGRASIAATAARASIGEITWWPWVLLVASILSLKFDWVYWWAGKLWGRGMIEVWAGRSERARRNYERAERWAAKLGWLGIFLAYVPLPLPLMPVVFVLAGASGMSLRKFLILDYLAGLVWMLGFFWLGWSLGEPAVAVLNEYARIAGWVVIGILVVMVFSLVRGSRRKPTARPQSGS